MTKYQKEFLDKCIITDISAELPLFDDIYILPTNKKHDSGYKIMYIVGGVHKTNKYYLLDTYCDVVNLGYFKSSLKNVNIDIKDNGIIHLWNNYQLFRCEFRVSSCTFEFVDKEVHND